MLLFGAPTASLFALNFLHWCLISAEKTQLELEFEECLHLSIYLSLVGFLGLQLSHQVSLPRDFPLKLCHFCRLLTQSENKFILNLNEFCIKK